VLAIGTDALCRLTVAGFASLGAMDPEGARPFQAGRKGITIGEGAAAFVVARQGRPMARILGSAMIGEAFHATQPDPSGAGAARAMRDALQDARLQTVDAVSAHGTATLQNDAMECRAIASVFGAAVPVSSQKSQLGHTLGAAGALELAACILMLREQTMYSTHGLSAEVVDPACRGVQHVFSPRRMRISTIAKNSFAFGGQNSVLILGAA
jgi:3-oxoacyl-(acyl-carrier-protein) synthase